MADWSFIISHQLTKNVKRTVSMNQHYLLSTVLASIKKRRYTPEQLWEDYQPLWKELGWQLPQLTLWLKCLPNAMVNGKISETASSYNTQQPDLTTHLATLLEQAGKPLPIALLLKKLPAGVTVSEQQLRKLAQQDSRLEIKGPLIRRV